MVCKKIVLFLMFSLLLISCSTPSLSEATEFSDVIESFSPAYVPTCGPVSVTFSEPIGPDDSLVHKAPSHLFHLKPSIKGEAWWTNGGRTLEFRPEKGAFSSGQEYYCTLKTSKLIDGKDDFIFKVAIAEKECEFSLTGVIPEPEDDSNLKVVICCRLVLSEPAVGSNLEKLVNCRMVQEDYKVKIEEISKTEYDFRIYGFKRGLSSNEVSVSFDAKKIGFKPVLDVHATIPAGKTFKITNIDRINSSNPYVEIDFTDRLDETQDLTGLISIDETDDISIQRERSRIKVFFPASLESFNLRVSNNIRSRSKANLEDGLEQYFGFEEIVPQVEIPLSGTILPDGDNLRLPFKAVNLRAVDIAVVKIYTSNVLQFLQENDLDGDSEIRRVGRLVYRKTARLDKNAAFDLHHWNDFSIDLYGMFRKEKGALYQIRLSFKKEYSLFGQEEYERGISLPEENGITEVDNAEWDKAESYFYYEDVDWDEYDWSERDDPTKASYYMCSGRFPKYNLAASNIGLIVKSSDKGRLWTIVSDLKTATPMAGVKVTAYNYQLRNIGSGISTENGFADFQVSGQPFVVTASAEGYTTYLKVANGKEKSLSRFDVGGKKIVKGVKGYAYGERGVWRPGDTLHVTFILEDKNRSIPANHPVEMILHTPEGQFYSRYVLTGGKDGFYAFTIPTRESDPTGTWKAEFNVGGSVFKKDLKIETVKPNRLKINFSSSNGMLMAGKNDTINVESHWLTGPAATGMETSLEMTLGRVGNPFKGFEDYVFNNPLSDFKFGKYELGSDVLDSLGSCTIPFTIDKIHNAPGMLIANVSCRVEEPGGGFSISAKSQMFSPYSTYAGIHFDATEFETDKNLNFPVVCIDGFGKPVSDHELNYKIYRLGWSWWWETNTKDLDSYINSHSAELVEEGTVICGGTESVIPFRVDYPSWGKYLILVKDEESGHATGGTIYVDWPLWRGHSDKSDPTAISMLSFSTDKKSYEVGETVNLYLPAAKGGRALVSLENASGVISRTWVATAGSSETVHKFTVTKAMSPNFYIHVSLLQPHRNTVNDLPIRMYGVQNITVTDKNSYLYPVIDAPAVIEPEQRFTIRVREQKGRPMTYTLAIVDEGLLDLTSFRTPNPWQTMNEREALGVKTWDIYDDVIGAYGGSWSKVLSIGGDEALRSGTKKDNRFKPVVEYYGPFTLEGGTATHRLKLPMYVGSVRIMVVAGHAGAYGNAEKTMAVCSPLMLVPTLPRSLACGETVKLPVNVFATEKGIGKVNVEVKVNGPVKIQGSSTALMSFSDAGDDMATFELKADDRSEGIAEVTVTARNGSFTATDKISITVSNPNAPVVTIRDTCITAGSSSSLFWTPFREGSREGVTLELSSFPSISFVDAFTFVQSYRYLCTEQLSSMGMYLLYGARFLPTWQQKEAKNRLGNIIRELYSRQLSSGGFAYWPGDGSANEWATSMAGQVLVEAGKQGLPVSKSVISQWQVFQKKTAKVYKRTKGNLSDLQQAYRLYTLALSGEPDAAAMNRLKENSVISNQARLRLSAAYAIAGKVATAAELAATSSSEDTEEISDRHYTFQDRRRDDAMILETLVLVGNKTEALRKAQTIASSFSSYSCSTQELAFTSLALSRLSELVGKEPAIGTVDGTKMSGTVYAKSLVSEKGIVMITNSGKSDMYVRMVEKHVPDIKTNIPANESGISLKVVYTDENGNTVIPAELRQGQGFYVNVTVKDLRTVSGERNMALTFPCPSGWEIWNDRLFGGSGQPSARGCKYRDIRDNNVQWFFSLGPGESKNFKTKVLASYEGNFYGAPVWCEDMYDTSYHANASSYKTKVVD
ncbi:MAG: alpha-2-macroglobulin [Bacteroidales bacterium]|nr:alpha-2-macroglobulin [Candidatus Cacconaster scatequi]